MAALSAGDWIQLLGLAGLAGAAGQCVRAIVGLKQTHDAVSTAGGRFSDHLDVPQMVISLIIGAVSGMLASMALDVSVAQISSQQVLTFLAAGYAGADFIEGFMSRYVPQGTTPMVPPVTEAAVTATVTAAVTDPSGTRTSTVTG